MTLELPRARWRIPQCDSSQESRLINELGISPLLARVLVARGITEPKEAEEFLNPRLEYLHDPYLLPDCAQAVQEIMLAKEKKERIFVHGDYDVDGISSAAIWARSLKRLGFDVIAHVPHRIREGYGIHEAAVREAVQQGAKLLLTCDCGSSAFKTVEIARELGMRVVITDHHLIGNGNHEGKSTLPRANAVVNPSRSDSQYPFPYLSGAGVAFKVAQAVAEECGAKPKQFQRAFLDLVCLGTIADVVPLIGENRILAYYGLDALEKTQKKGLRALLRVSDLDEDPAASEEDEYYHYFGKPAKKKITSWDVGWRLSPRINAAGRIDDAAHSLALLLTEDEEEASEIAKLLNQQNVERREEQKRVFEHALEIIYEREIHKKNLIFLYAEGWHPGVIGIVAGKIAEMFYRPTFLATIHDTLEIARGSGRSIPNFHLYNALEANKHLFLSCGGHAMAAGFNIHPERLEEASETLCKWADEAIAEIELVPQWDIDAEIKPEHLTFRAVKELCKLEPFGEANPEPRFLVRNVEFAWIRETSNPNHMQFAITNPSNKSSERFRGNTTIEGIAFDFGERLRSFPPCTRTDLIVHARLDSWNGTERMRLQLLDFMEND